MNQDLTMIPAKQSHHYAYMQLASRTLPLKMVERAWFTAMRTGALCFSSTGHV